MRRLILPFAVVLILLIGITLGRPGLRTVAQESTDQHPIVGAWVVDTEADNPDNPLSLIIFHDDGTFIETGSEGTGVGAWEATGEQTAALTILFPPPAEEAGAPGFATVRVQIEVDETGDTFTGMYTVEFPGAEGSTSGEVGPVSVTAERISVEPMGTPVMSMEEMMGAMAEGTPTP